MKVLFVEDPKEGLNPPFNYALVVARATTDSFRIIKDRYNLFASPTTLYSADAILEVVKQYVDTLADDGYTEFVARTLFDTNKTFAPKYVEMYQNTYDDLNPDARETFVRKARKLQELMKKSNHEIRKVYTDDTN